MIPSSFHKTTRRKSDYRPCVGMVLFRADGKVWSGRRAGPGGTQMTGDYIWQFPQGGIDKGEPPSFAAIRELYEETGIGVQHIAPLAKTKGWLYYDFPSDYKSKSGHNWRGQRQRWYAYRYLGTDADFDLHFHETEFTEFEWIELAQAPQRIVPFKRDIYEELARIFAPFARPVK